MFMLNSSVTAYLHLSGDAIQLANTSMRPKLNIGCRCRVIVKWIKPVFWIRVSAYSNLAFSFML